MSANIDISPLEKNIIEVIKESQIKLGYTPNDVTLYYPPQSIALMTGTDASQEDFVSAINDYEGEVLKKLSGKVSEDKIGVTVPAESVLAIHNNVKASDFLVEFINAVKKGCSMEKAKEIFLKHNKAAVLKEIEDDEFDLLAYFPDGTPDAYKYCIADDLGGISYHRFTNADFEELFK